MKAAEIIGRIIQEMHAFDIVLPEKFSFLATSNAEPDPKEVFYSDLISALVDAANFIEKSEPDELELVCSWEPIPIVDCYGKINGEWVCGVSFMPRSG